MSEYTTVEKIADYLAIAEESLPFDIERLIKRASELIYDTTLGASDQDLAVAERATNMQIEYWLLVDESMDIMGAPDNIKLGDFSTNQKFSTLAPRAYRLLWSKGMLTRDVRMGTFGNNLVYNFFDRGKY